MIGSSSSLGDAPPSRSPPRILGRAAVPARARRRGAVGGYGYQVGVSANQAWTDKLEADLQRFQEDNLGLRDQLAQTALSASSAKTALEELRRRYAAEVPDGELAGLLARVEGQLRAGVEPARLAFLIDAAGQDAGLRRGAGHQALPAAHADRHRPRRRGAVRRSHHGDGERRIGLRRQRAARGLVRSGRAGRARLSHPRWPRAAGRGHPAARHRMLVDGLEYRFSAIAGPTSFVEITGQACPFP